MKLAVWKATVRSYGFGLRHLPIFFLLCLLVGAPRYLYGQLPTQSWQTTLLVQFLEILLAAMVTGIMVWTMIRDRRGERWTALASIGDAFQRTPMILGAAIVIATVVLGLSGLGMYLGTLHPFASAAPSVFLFILKLIFCMAIPCAAVSESGVFDTLWQSARLSAGSRLRILAVYLLTLLPFSIIAAIAVALSPDDIQASLQAGNLPMLWILLGGALGNAVAFTVPVAIHEQLAELEEELPLGETAAVFD